MAALHTRPVLALLLCLTGLAGCNALAGSTRAPADYPSLAIRPAEFAMPAQPAPELPPPPAPAVLGQLAALEDEARAAHAAFLAAAPAARSAAAAAASAPAGSEAWSVAHIALAALSGQRSAAMVPLAQLDIFYGSAASNGESVERIGASRDAVAALVAEQDRLIASVASQLAR